MIPGQAHQGKQHRRVVPQNLLDHHQSITVLFQSDLHTTLPSRPLGIQVLVDHQHILDPLHLQEMRTTHTPPTSVHPSPKTSTQSIQGLSSLLWAQSSALRPAPQLSACPDHHEVRLTLMHPKRNTRTYLVAATKNTYHICTTKALPLFRASMDPCQNSNDS